MNRRAESTRPRDDERWTRRTPQIHWVQLRELRDRDVRSATRCIERLAEPQGDLIDVRIAGHREGPRRQVQISTLMRGQALAAKGEDETPERALARALGALEREVHDVRRRRRERRAVRPHEPPLLGLVDRVFRDVGYGFVLTDDGAQVYFHRNAVQGGLEFGELREGQRVGLDVELGERGLQATALLSPPPGAPPGP